MADAQRTEQPTKRRLDKARQEGNFPQSKELVSAVQFLGFLALVTGFGAAWFFQNLRFTRALLARAFREELTAHSLVALIETLILPQLTPLLLGGAALVFVVLSAQLVSTGFGLAPGKLMPDPSRLNFFSRIAGLPAQNLPVFGQALLLIPTIAWAVYYEISENLNQFLTLPALSPQGGLLLVAAAYKTLLWRIGGLFLLVGIGDYIFQKRRYLNRLRMTKQEAREEAKEQQGNPHMKARIRRIQRDLARKQMMKEVATATTVIVNPTHYAVAIRYSMSSSSAPKVVAKGRNYLAQRIRQLALEHQVPIVENAPLARALYKSSNVGQEIPADLYRAVAEILAYIYKLMGRRFAV